MPESVLSICRPASNCIVMQRQVDSSRAIAAPHDEAYKRLQAIVSSMPRWRSCPLWSLRRRTDVDRSKRVTGLGSLAVPFLRMLCDAVYYVHGYEMLILSRYPVNTWAVCRRKTAPLTKCLTTFTELCSNPEICKGTTHSYIASLKKRNKTL